MCNCVASFVRTFCADKVPGFEGVFVDEDKYFAVEPATGWVLL